MALSLSMIDNGDGSGGKAVVSGADTNTTTTVFAQAVSGDLGTNIWVSQGTLSSGNGTLAVAPVPLGYYWWYATGTVSGVTPTISNFVYQNVTNGLDPVHWRVMLGAQAVIQSLMLPGIANTNVVIRKVPTDRDVGQGKTYGFPCVQIAPVIQEQMVPTEGVCQLDDVGYPVGVFFVSNDNQDEVQNHSRYLKWRQSTARALRNQRISTAHEIYNCYVEPNLIIDPSAFFSQMLFVSTLVLRFRSREVRGFGT